MYKKTEIQFPFLVFCWIMEGRNKNAVKLPELYFYQCPFPCHELAMHARYGLKPKAEWILAGAFCLDMAYRRMSPNPPFSTI